MLNMDDDTRKDVLGEAIMDELKAIREYVEDIPEIKKDIKDLQVRATRVEEGMNVIKAVVREHESDIRILKQKTA
jgi:hypothetical protein